MEIKYSIFRRGKKGSEDAKSYKKVWTLRFTLTDELGNPKRKTYQFATRNDALDARTRLEAELSKTHGKSVIGNKMTFRDLAAYAKRSFYRPAEIVDGRKVAGIKAHRQTCILIDSLVRYFGDKRLANITRNDLDGYKSWRLKQGDRRGKLGQLKPSERKPVSLSTVNRSLAIFKHMMKFAHAEGWISRDVTLGSKAIDSDAEKARTRTLTASEEALLLASCVGTRNVTYQRKGRGVTASVSLDNPYLKAVILLGLDAGLRRNEVLTLEWRDIDFERGFLHVQSRHTKTQRSRNVPLCDRLKSELVALPNFGMNGKIFPFADFKRSWATALRVAGIGGLTFHDLRRTFVTRLSVKGVPLAVVGKLAGHSTLATTQKHYISTDDLSIIDEIRARLDAPSRLVAESEFVN
jgi:integrase